MLNGVNSTAIKRINRKILFTLQLTYTLFYIASILLKKRTVLKFKVKPNESEINILPNKRLTQHHHQNLVNTSLCLSSFAVKKMKIIFFYNSTGCDLRFIFCLPRGSRWLNKTTFLFIYLILFTALFINDDHVLTTKTIRGELPGQCQCQVKTCADGIIRIRIWKYDHWICLWIWTFF